MEKITKFQAAEIALMLSNNCIDHKNCDDCAFITKKGCMLSDIHDQVLPDHWKVIELDLFMLEVNK